MGAFLMREHVSGLVIARRLCHEETAYESSGHTYKSSESGRASPDSAEHTFSRAQLALALQT